MEKEFDFEKVGIKCCPNCKKETNLYPHFKKEQIIKLFLDTNRVAAAEELSGDSFIVMPCTGDNCYQWCRVFLDGRCEAIRETRPRRQPFMY